MTTIVLDISGEIPCWPDDVDYLASEAGSWYAVLHVRRVNSRQHANRWRYSVQRITPPRSPDEPIGNVLEFHWNRRPRR